MLLWDKKRRAGRPDHWHRKKGEVRMREGTHVDMMHRGEVTILEA